MKSIKTVLSVIFLFILLLALPMAGAGAEETCEHSWVFVHTITYHTGYCAYCQAEYPKEEHYTSCLSDDDTCYACGAKISEGAVIESEMHYFDENVLEHDEHSHFNVCQNCSKHVNVEYHYTTCQHPEGCLGCGAKTADGAVMNEFSHDWHKKYDAREHWDECALCGQEADREAHFIGCTAEDKTACTACGARASEGAVLEKTAHYYSGEIDWQCTENEHWFVCIACGKDVTRGAHYAVCTNPGVCHICGIAWDKEPIHINNDPDEYIPLDEEHHQFVCEYCGETVLEAHDFDEDGVCTSCGYQQSSQETVPAKYALKGVSYDGQTVTGFLTQTEGTAPATELSVRITFFVTGNYYMATSAEVEADGSFEVEGVGPIEYITLSASGLTGNSQERTLFDATALEIK